MKQIKWLLFIFIIFIFLICLYKNYNKYILDNFENNENSLHLYVITLHHNDRLHNIKKQQSKISNQIHLFDAVKGDFINLDKIWDQYHFNYDFFNETHADDKKRKREVGCYLSHLNLYNLIKYEHNNVGYTIVFEDDFSINDDFIDQINKIIRNMLESDLDFDIMFLGQTLTQNKGGFVMDNIYHLNNDQDLWGTHGLLINNRNMDKIIEKMEIVDNPVDVKIVNLGKSRDLKVFVIYPSIVNNSNLNSTINELDIETFDTIYHNAYTFL